MEDDPANELLKSLPHRAELQWREHGETIQRYEAAGKFGRWFIGRQNPRAVEYYKYLKYQESVGNAIRHAAADPDNERLIGAAT